MQWSSSSAMRCRLPGTVWHSRYIIPEYLRKTRQIETGQTMYVTNPSNYFTDNAFVSKNIIMSETFYDVSD